MCCVCGGGNWGDDGYDHDDMYDYGYGYEPTNLMFYWSGFEETGMEPQPMWFNNGNSSCNFSIGEPDQQDPMARGRCDVLDEDENGVPLAVDMWFDNNPEEKVSVKITDDFGAGEDEPNAAAKWSNGESIFIWMLTDEDFAMMWGGMDDDYYGDYKQSGVQDMLWFAQDYIQSTYLVDDGSKKGPVQWEDLNDLIDYLKQYDF